jgi:hypothetical protein
VARFFIIVEIIKFREGIKFHEDKRIKKAFILFTQLSKSSNLKIEERRENYRHFLKKINDDCDF